MPTPTPLFKYCTSIETPDGETYVLDSKISNQDMKYVMEVWSKARTEMILRIEQDAKTKIFNYLREKGYRLIALERIKLA